MFLRHTHVSVRMTMGESVVILKVNKFGLKVALGIPLQFHVHIRMYVVVASEMPWGTPHLDLVY